MSIKINPVEIPADVLAEDSPIERARELLACAQTDAAVYLTDVRQGEAYVDPARGLAALRDAQVGTGHAVLAVREELSATRMQIGELAEAVRGLAAAVTAAASPLPEAIAEAGEGIAEQISELRIEVRDQLRELGVELCTEVREAGASVDALLETRDEPARSWLRRLRGGRR